MAVGWAGVVCCGCAPTQTGSVPKKAAPISRNFSDEHRSEPPGDIRFVDKTVAGGIDFIYRNGEAAGHYSILESLGGGVAILDFDRDGREDLCFAGGGEFRAENTIAGLPCGLYQNQGNGKFADAALSAGLGPGKHYSHGITRADYDSDGFPDLLVTGYGGLQLFHNDGDGTFTELAEAAHLDDQLWSSSAAWGDLNRDGHLDLYVVHYVNWSFENDPFCAGPKPDQREVCPPRRFEGLPDTLYLSNGDGTFRDASKEWGLRQDGKGLGAVIADLDLDADLDIYVTNDTVPNFLYRNDENRKLTDISLISGTSLSDRGLPDGSMGVDLYDYNLDGLPDLWVVNYESESAALYENEGGMFFRHVSMPTGVTSAGSLFVGWGTRCFDADRDGDEDMFVSNGHVIRYPVNAPLRQTPLLFENLEGRRFRNVAPDAGDYFREAHMGRGAAGGDLDGDGDQDLAVSHTNEPVSILLNETPPRGEALAVDLIGTSSPRDAIGAVVRIQTSAGEQVRHWEGGGSYASTSGRTIFFGLGPKSRVESLQVTWPSGRKQTVTEIPSHGFIRLVESP